MTGPKPSEEVGPELPAAHQRIEAATAELEQAKTELRPIPAKIAATDLDPDATRARQRLERRGLQMVLRLLAFNAEAWLAEELSALEAHMPGDSRPLAYQIA